MEQIIGRLPGPYDTMASQELKKINNWEYSPIERRMAKDAIIKFAEDHHLDTLAEAAKAVSIPGLKDS